MTRASIIFQRCQFVAGEFSIRANMSGETLNLDRLQQLEHAVQSELEDTVKFINETRQFLSQDDQKSAYAVIDELAKSFVSVRQTRVDTERSLRDTDSHFLSDQEPQQTVDEFFDNAMKKYKEARVCFFFFLKSKNM